MSEKEKPEAEGEGAEVKKKKKGKLPILLVLVLVLGGGGFFAMKGRGGGEPKAKKLGVILELPEEFLANLREPNTYIRAKIALHLEEGFDKKKVEDKLAAVEDSIYLKLSSKALAELRTVEGKLKLKREIAKNLNSLLNEKHDEEKKEEPKDEKEGGKADEKSEKSSKQADWDSETGPILKIYFKSFATQ